MVILKIKKMYYFTFLAALFMGLSCTGKETPDYKEPPHVTPPLTGVESTYDKADGAIRLVSYNVGSFSKYNDSIEMIAKMMLELQADAVCMNEVDSCTTRASGLDQPKVLAAKMGEWHHCFGRALYCLGGSYGNAIVVSPDFMNKGTETIVIPQGTGAQVRTCAVFKTDKFVIMAAHLDHVGEEARLDGVKRITDWAKKNYGNSDMPVFLCGDMNCEPQDAPIVKFKNDWNLISVIKNTFPAGQGKVAVKCIDFVFALKNNAKYEVMDSDVPMNFKYGNVLLASDHLPIYVDVKLK